MIYKSLNYRMALLTFSGRISASREASDAVPIADAIAGSPLAEAIGAADESLAGGRKLTEKVNKAYRIGWLLLLLVFVCGCGPNKYLPSKHPLMPPSFYVPEQIRVALVLGSGGIRGTAHVGVLEVLEEEGIPIDLIVGCSAGSIVGSLYAATPCVNRIKSDVWNIRSDSLLEINLFECRYGLSQGCYIRNMLEKQLCHKEFRDLKIPLVVVASDLYTGELIPMGNGNLIKSVQASCSIPFVFTPCKYMGRILVDGGVINPVPARVARDLGADIIIAVDLCELLPKTCPSNLFEIASRSAEIAFMWQNQVCTRYADVVIRPKTCGIGTFNDDMKYVLYEAGKRAAREQLPKIRQMLAHLPQRKCQPKKWKLVCLPPYTPQIYKDP